MHPCLRLPEIAQEICDHVPVNLDPGPSRMTLLSMALTCRTFREPALASLWAYIPGVAPLIKCAGRDLWRESATGANGWELHLSRPLSPSDIASMRKYARLVRHFANKYGERFEPFVGPDIWEALWRNDVIFSNLWSLELDCIYDIDSIQLFFTENLTSFTISLFRISPESAAYHVSKLAEVSAGCPNLTSLQLDHFERLDQLEGIAAALPNWRYLTRFVSTHTTSDLLHGLSSSSASLRHLDLGLLVPRGRGNHWLPFPTGTVFPVLETLSGSFNQVSDAKAVIDYLPTVGLQRLTVSVKPGTPADQEEDWLGLCQSIKKYSGSLKKLDFVQEQEYYRNGDQTTVPLYHTLISFLVAGSFPLTHITISNLGAMDISDKDLKMLTKALPRLEEFHLTSYPLPGNIGYNTTIAGLAFFAENCPHLSHLTLGFDAREGKVPQQGHYSIQAPVLQRLDVLVSPIDNPDPVAIFLLNIFPNMEAITWNKNYDDTLDGSGLCLLQWSYIHNMVGMRSEVMYPK